MLGLIVSPIWGAGRGRSSPHRSQSLLSLSGLTFPFPWRLGGHLWDWSSSLGHGEGASSRPTTGSLPLTSRPGKPDFPMKLCFAFLQLTSLLSSSQGAQASYNYLTCVKMCHYPHSSSELKRGHLFSLCLININDAGIGSKCISTGASGAGS